MLIILSIAAFFFIVINLLMWTVLKRTTKQVMQYSHDRIKISIVVAAKNEEKNITALINSVYANRISQEDFEVIVVDDNSTDRTSEKVNALSEKFNSLKLISPAAKIYRGKKGALAAGINESKFDYIMITDADCVVSEKWIETFAKDFAKGADFIFGNAPLIKQNGFVNTLSCFENLRSSILTFSAAKLGMPYSAAARSFGFKKSAFEKVKGYENTTETLSGDDDLLLREAVKAKMKINSIIEPDAFVFSETKKTFREYLVQKSRHTKTSIHYLFRSQLILGLWHITNLLLMLSLFLIPFNPYYGIFFILKLLFDVIVVLSLQKKFGYAFNFLEIVFLQPVYEVMLIINFFAGIILPDKWK